MALLFDASAWPPAAKVHATTASARKSFICMGFSLGAPTPRTKHHARLTAQLHLAAFCHRKPHLGKSRRASASVGRWRRLRRHCHGSKAILTRAKGRRPRSTNAGRRQCPLRIRSGRHRPPIRGPLGAKSGREGLRLACPPPARSGPWPHAGGNSYRRNPAAIRL